MNKSLITGLIVGGVAVTAAGAFAGYQAMDNRNSAEVLNVEPMMKTVRTPRQVCSDVVVTHAGESRYLVERVQFQQSVNDIVETTAYRPGIRWMDRVGVLARHLQNGSIHRYLGYSFVALLAVLVVVSL